MNIKVEYMGTLYTVVHIFENGKCVGIEEDGTIKIFDITLSKAVMDNLSLILGF